jgi:hypothetical protein
MMWNYGIRKLDNNYWAITEEYGDPINGHVIVGILDQEMTKEDVRLMCKDLLKALKKRIKRSVVQGDYLI